MHTPISPEARLVSSLVARAIEEQDWQNAWELSLLESTLWGVGICHCPNCGRIVGAFPPGMVRGWRYGDCVHCERERGPIDRILFRIQNGRVRDSYYGCGHEYRHGDGEVMKHCIACTGESPPLVPVEGSHEDRRK